MGHHHKDKKDKSNQYDQYNQYPNANQSPNIPTNFDISSLLGMLNNIDINQLSSMLSQLTGKNSNDIKDSMESLSKGNNQAIADMLKNVDVNQISSMLSSMGINPQDFSFPSNKKGDIRVEVLNSLKPFLPEDKCKMIDDIINFLRLKGVLDKAVPKKKR
ncbi:hypothetical protein FDN13_04725 [Caloramator sp. E03]|uniref:hypothetical protein n=1 Tax=Caloramator sp. E03 TaxID=2576307 RepID=UPI001110CC1F|nr:hypothetical protein [Caloramator sp. E03]QCX33070.1 hypothetical protein FDN13_04725 [Caloramator sp. E03]